MNNCKINYNSIKKIYVSNQQIEECIEEMKSSNCTGFDGINANMIKNGKSPLLIKLIKTLMNAIFCSGHVPSNFNRSIINPIIKDKKKKVFDTNNFRPISISNCFAQIFERLILKLSPNLYAC